jgi:hypothetical protein
MIKNPETFCKLVAENFKRLTDAEFYYTRFDKQFGWAMIMLHEETGTVAIHSDYGDWVFSWPSPGRGSGTLKEFICHGSYDYMACKFDTGRKEEFDADATEAAFKKILFDMRRLKEIGKEKARDVFDGLDDAEYSGTSETFYHSLPSVVTDWLEGDWYENIVYDHSAKFYWLRDGILPALVTELSKTLPPVKCANCQEPESVHGIGGFYCKTFQVRP